MVTRKAKKMTKQRPGSSAQKTAMKWNQSQLPTALRATGAAVFGGSRTGKSENLGSKASSDSPYNLQMIGRKVLVEEEDLEATPDVKSGLTRDVCDALSSGKLVLSDESKFALFKYPYKGTVLSVGEKCRKIKTGDRIHFASLGVQRFEFRGKQFLVMHEEDVHGTYAPVV